MIFTDVASTAHIARFSAAARQYDRHAALHDQVAGTLLDFAESLTPPAWVLDAGCGTGVLTARLAGRHPAANIEAIDLSPAMIAMARQRPLPQVRWRVADLCSATAAPPCDWVVSSSALQWVDNLPAAVAHLARQLRPDGYLCVAVMTLGTLQELHELRAGIAPDKRPPRQLPTQADLLSACAAAGLVCGHEALHTHEVAYTDGATMLRTLHEQGVTGGALSQGAATLNRSELQRLMAAYDAQCRLADGRVRARFDVGYVLARKESGQ